MLFRSRGSNGAMVQPNKPCANLEFMGYGSPYGVAQTSSLDVANFASFYNNVALPFNSHNSEVIDRYEIDSGTHIHKG